MSGARAGRKWLAIGATLLVLGIVAALVVRAAAIGYVQGEGFRRLVGQNFGRELKASAEFAPFRLSDQALLSDGVKAAGGRESWFSALEMNELRATVSFGRLMEGIWQIDRVEAEQASLVLDGPRAAESAPELRERQPGPPSRSWWPDRVELQAASVHRGQVRWEGGRVRDVALDGKRLGDEWKFHGEGGTLEHGAWPPLDVRSFRLRQRGKTLFVENAELREGPAGAVVVNGEVRFGEAVELDAQLDRLPIDPLLAPDWRLRLHGDLNGAIRVRGPLPAAGAPEISGSLRLTDGHLEALPVLDELAVFTQLAQFRKLTLSRVEGDFRQTAAALEVSRLVAESAGLMRLEGAFRVENGFLKGDFQVGLAPATLQWLPGARTHLFIAARDGYLWAPMHMEGPVESPHEDLSGRLLAAVAEGGVDTVRKAAEGLIEQLPGAGQQLQDAAKKALDLFLK